MSVLRAPARRLTSPLAVVAVAALVAAVATTLAVTGGTGVHRAATHPRPAHRTAPGSHPATGSDGTLAGVPLQRARCSDWRAASGPEQLQTVRALAQTAGGASTTGGVGITLSDGRAIALFDRVCATPQTSGFVLYGLYMQAAAFSRVHPGGA